VLSYHDRVMRPPPPGAIVTGAARQAAESKAIDARSDIHSRRPSIRDHDYDGGRHRDLLQASAMRTSKLVKGATLKVYPGFPHGMCTVEKDRINADLLAFLKT
jgi:hypothetical protein